MLFVPIRYINNGEALDQVTLNRDTTDIQQNLEEIIDRLVTLESSSGGSVTETPDTLALRDEYGTTQFSAPRIATNPFRKGDADSDKTASTLALRDANGTFKIGPPSSVDHPMRSEDMVGASVIFPFNPGSDWILADGRAVSRTTYAPLYGKIGTTFGSGDGSTTFNVPDLRELLEVVNISGSGSGVFGAWDNSFPTSGTAPEDGIIHVRSSHNDSVSITIDGVQVQQVSDRDKYGTGNVAASAAIKKGQTYSIHANGYRRFLPFNVSLPEPTKIALPVDYYIRGR